MTSLLPLTLLDDNEAEAALSRLRTYCNVEGVTRDELRKFLVRDDFATDNQTRFFVAPHKISDHDSPLGRSSYRSIVYDATTTPLCTRKIVGLPIAWGLEGKGMSTEICSMHRSLTSRNLVEQTTFLPHLVGQVICVCHAKTKTQG